VQRCPEPSLAAAEFGGYDELFKGALARNLQPP
jgi:hypothetical protein